MKKVLALSTLSSVTGDLAFIELRGIDALVDHPGASPILGYIAHSFLPARRFFGHYGGSKSGFFCRMEKGGLAESFRNRNDCPLDSNSEWLQRLFPSQDGATFTPNEIPIDFVSELTPRVIGLMLARVALVSDESSASEWAQLIEDLTKLLHENLDKTKEVGTKLQLLRPQVKALALEPGQSTGEYTPRSGTKELSPRMMKAEEATNRRTALYLAHVEPHHREAEELSKTVHRTMMYPKESRFREIAKLFVGAIKESRNLVSLTDGYTYPRYLPEQTLLAFMIKTIDSKAELLEFIRVLPSELLKDPTFAYDPVKEAEFVSNTWTKVAGSFSEREQLIRKYSAVPRLVTLREVKHVLGQQVVKYPDCGETSLRNFFNIVLFDPASRTYNVGFMKDSWDPALVAFYTQHKTPGLDQDELHEQWAREVVAGRPGVVYKSGMDESNPQFEIRSLGNVRNMFTLIGDLLVKEEDRARWTSSSREEQLEILASMFSRDGFTVRIVPEDITAENGETATRLYMLVNEHLDFMWKFNPTHFEIEFTAQLGSDSIDEDFNGIWAAAKRGQKLDLLPLIPFLLSSHPVLAPDFADQYSTDPTTATNSLYAILTAASFEERIEVLSRIILLPESVLDPLLPLVRKLILWEEDLFRSHPDEFFGCQHRRDAGFPFGIPEDLIEEKSGFRRVSHQELVSLFGEETATKMGISWETEIFGQKAIIADRHEYLWNRPVDVESCLRLNASPKSIESVFDRRESQLQSLRWASPGVVTEQKRNIYERNRFTGFALLGVEQFLDIQKKGFAHRILPRTNFFWDPERMQDYEDEFPPPRCAYFKPI